jgi:putative Ca2+/H+ antiporter (TMEM165/GDT1 family)
VAAIAVVSGANLLRFLSVRTLRLTTAGVLLVLAVYSAIQAAR